MEAVSGRIFTAVAQIEAPLGPKKHHPYHPMWLVYLPMFGCFRKQGYLKMDGENSGRSY